MIRQENIENYTLGNCQLSIVNCQIIKYSAFGEATLDTLGVTRQGYIGKEKNVENGLGDHTSTELSDHTSTELSDHTSTELSDHGVRKYDYETGRFNLLSKIRDNNNFIINTSLFI